MTTPCSACRGKGYREAPYMPPALSTISICGSCKGTGQRNLHNGKDTQ